MNKKEWLKFVRHSTEAHHIREIFNGTYALMNDPEVQEIFLNRINHLLGTLIHPHTKEALENLKEDIELEIEFGAMRKGAKIPVKTIGRPFESTKQERIMNMIEKIRAQLDEIEEMINADALCKEQENTGVR